MNWGTKIALAYLAFACGLFALVYQALKTEYHLVTDNYYEKELEHDAIMVARKNSENLPEPVKISYHAEHKEVHIFFPEDLSDIEGEVLFYHPVNSHKDRTFPIPALDEGRFSIDKKDLEPGRWKVQLSWKHEEDAFFDEKTLIIP